MEKKICVNCHGTEKVTSMYEGEKCEVCGRALDKPTHKIKAGVA